MVVALRHWIQSFVPETYKTDLIKFWKGRVLVYLLLLCIVFAFIAITASLFTGVFETVYFNGFILVFLIIDLIVFKRTGSFNFVANCFAFIGITGLIYGCLTSGGIYSENVFWMSMFPLLTLFLSDVKTGLFWTFITSIVFIILYFITKGDINAYFDQILIIDPSHYLISGILFVVFIVFINALFKIQLESYLEKTIQQNTRLQSQQKEIKNKTNRLEITKQQLIERNKELEQYAYATSHDLKQPLKTIISFTNLLQNELEESNALNEESRKLFSFISKGTADMDNLVSDVLKFAKNSGDSYNPFEMTDLNELLVEVEQSISKSIYESEAIITYQELPSIDVVPVKIKQLFQNLLINAIKFRSEERKLKIDISAYKQNQDWIFEIEDNGIGIQKEQLKQVFLPFVKLHPSSQYNGSGIGLSTCKKIVESHGGKIWIESEFGKGTSVLFTLPDTN